MERKDAPGWGEPDGEKDMVIWRKYGSNKTYLYRSEMDREYGTGRKAA